MALVPLELWENYESIVDNMQSIIRNEVISVENAYRNKVLALNKENDVLKRQLRDLRAANTLSARMH